MNLFKKSPNLVMNKIKNDYYVFHKYYGNLSTLNEESYNFLNSYLNPSEPPLSSNDYYYDVFMSMQDNYFINNVNENELLIVEGYAKERAANYNKGDLIKALQLIMSNGCNFNCKYCFQDSTDSNVNRLSSHSSNEPKEMTFSVADKAMRDIIDIVSLQEYPNLTVEFFGGEPLLNWDTIKQILDKYGNGNDTNVEISYIITTNASLINEEVIEYCKKYGVHVVVSFDSPSNFERVDANGRNTNERVIGILKELCNNGLKPSINSVISKYTIDAYDYKGLINLANSMGIKTIGLILDLDADFGCENYSPEKLVEILINAYTYGTDLGMHITGYWEKIFAQINNTQPLCYVTGFKACPAIGCKISVEPSGAIFSCKCCTKQMGDINDLSRTFNNENYKAYVFELFDLNEKCEKCDLSNFCSGVCIGTLEKRISNELDRFEPNLCKIYKSITEKIIEYSYANNLLESIKPRKVGEAK